MKIFISYRRDDNAGYAGRLYDYLTRRFGDRNVFMDIDTIEPGQDFRKAIENSVGTCDVALIMIGRQWLNATDPQGGRPLDDPGDWVRAEIAAVLANPSVRVIPVLVCGASMPGPQELPDDLKDLAWRNAIELSDQRFQYDANRLIGVIESLEVQPAKMIPGGKFGLSTAIGHQRGSEAEITFIYPRTTQAFEPQIRQAGFSVRPLEYHLTDEEVAAIFHADHTGNEFFPDMDRARQVLHVCITELETNRPDLVVFGFLPPFGIAAQLLRVPAVSYVPSPVYRPWVSCHFFKDLPDELKGTFLDRAPLRWKQKLARGLSWMITQSPFFRQPTLAAAARELGWSPPRTGLPEMLDADVQLVNDLPAHYEGEDVGPHTHIAGPLFSRPADAAVAPDILRQFEPGDVPRVFVAMGSSAEKPYLLAAIEAVTRIPCRAVVLVPPHICSLEEARRRAGGSPHILLTDAFVAAHLVNAMADFAIIHGGQGTVQTAVFSGTPVVGVGMQWEQSSNIDRLVQRGAGIRIARNQWNPATIEQALRQLIASASFRACARQLKAELNAINGRQVTGKLIWDLVSATTKGTS